MTRRNDPHATERRASRRRSLPAAALAAGLTLLFGAACDGGAETEEGPARMAEEPASRTGAGGEEAGPLAGEEPRGDVGALTPIEERPGAAEEVVEDVDPSEAEAPHVSAPPPEQETQGTEGGETRSGGTEAP